MIELTDQLEKEATPKAEGEADEAMDDDEAPAAVDARSIYVGNVSTLRSCYQWQWMDKEIFAMDSGCVGGHGRQDGLKVDMRTAAPRPRRAISMQERGSAAGHCNHAVCHVPHCLLCAQNSIS